MKTIKALIVTACIAGAASLAQAQTAATPSSGGVGTGVGLNNGMVDGANKGGTGAEPTKSPKMNKKSGSKKSGSASMSSSAMDSDGAAGAKTTDGSTITPSGVATPTTH